MDHLRVQTLVCTALAAVLVAVIQGSRLVQLLALRHLLREVVELYQGILIEALVLVL